MIVGRKKERHILEETLSSNQAEFLALYGRRRIGKTYLINQFFKDKGIYFELTGMKDAKMPEQLRNFSDELSERFLKGKAVDTPKNWHEAFKLLRQQIEKLKTDKKIILFFDELPWLASKRSKFLEALDYLWNRHLSRNDKIVLVVCGSAASWMLKKVINNKAGLYGRLTKQIRLLPFTLTETEAFLQAKNIDLDRKQIIELYMAMGGVPKYLNYITRGKSAIKNINAICFSPDGPLFSEFYKLYHSLFDNHEHHVNIIKALAEKPAGMTKEDILKKINLQSGGSTTTLFRELEDSGFVTPIPSFGKSKRGKYYQLIDEYSIFYITWIDDIKNYHAHDLEEDYWMRKQLSSAWQAWSGLAFESICLKHIKKIKEALGISGVSTRISNWRYRPHNQAEQGAQIDLIIDRADNCINLCEIKYYNKPFQLSKADANKLHNRKYIFKEHTNTRKALFSTLITTYGAEKNPNYLASVDNQITMDALF